jgi:hypothetical protein
MKTLLYSLLAVLALASCSSENELIDNVFLEESKTEMFFVSVTANEGGSVNIQSKNYKKGETLSILATPLSDFEFSHWSPGNISENPLSIIVNSNIEIVANFKMKDDDNDGVFNIYDQCPNTPNDALVSYTGCEAQHFYEVMNYSSLSSYNANINFDYNSENLFQSVILRYFTKENCYVDIPLFSESFLRVKNPRNFEIIEESFFETTFKVEYDAFKNPSLVDTITYGFYPEENGKFKFESKRSMSSRWITTGSNYLELTSDKRRSGGIPQTKEKYLASLLNTLQNCNEDWLDKIWFTEVYQNRYFKYTSSKGTNVFLHIYPLEEYGFEVYVEESDCALRFRYSPQGFEKPNGIDLTSDFNPPDSGMLVSGISFGWDKNGDYSSNGIPDGFVGFSYNYREIGGEYEKVTISSTPIGSLYPDDSDVSNLIEITEAEFQEAISNLTLCQ